MEIWGIEEEGFPISLIIEEVEDFNMGMDQGKSTEKCTLCNNLEGRVPLAKE